MTAKNSSERGPSRVLGISAAEIVKNTHTHTEREREGSQETEERESTTRKGPG